MSLSVRNIKEILRMINLAEMVHLLKTRVVSKLGRFYTEEENIAGR